MDQVQFQLDSGPSSAWFTVQFQLDSGPISAWFRVQFQLELAVFDM